MMLIGEDPRKAIKDFSNQFSRDFLQQLKTSHGTKAIHINHFYQEYIANKEHIHMNSTRWPSLTEYAKYLGREGICRVEETDKGLHIAWIDNSPEALRRQDAIRKRERMERGDEEREQRLIQEQIERAHAAVQSTEDIGEEARELQRNEGERFKLSLGAARNAQTGSPSRPHMFDGERSKENERTEDIAGNLDTTASTGEEDAATLGLKAPPVGSGVKMSLSTAKSGKPKNVFAMGKSKDASLKGHLLGQPKKISEAERIMKEEMERKQKKNIGGPPAKRLKVA